MKSEPARRPHSHTLTVGLLAASFLASIILVGPDRWTKPAPHVSATVLALYEGTGVYGGDPEALCPVRATEQLDSFAAEHGFDTTNVCNLEGRAPDQPLVLRPRASTPGQMAWHLPEAVLYETSSMSLAQIGRLSLIKDSFVAHVVLGVLLWMLIGGGGSRLAMLAAPLLWFELAVGAANGSSGALTLGLIVGSLELLRRDRPTEALLAVAGAVFMDVQAMWYAPLGALALGRALQQGLLRGPEARSTILAVVLSGALLFSAAAAIWASLPMISGGAWEPAGWHALVLVPLLGPASWRTPERRSWAGAAVVYGMYAAVALGGEPPAPAASAVTVAEPPRVLPLTPGIPPGGHNRFPNPGFELGPRPWFSLMGPLRPYWRGFQLDRETVHSGEQSAVLRMTSEGSESEALIYGAIQEITPREMPRRLVAWFRVEDWQRGTDNQYLQIVLIAWRQETPEHADGNIQMAYVLGGIDEPPFAIGNRKFLFIGPKEPLQDKWVRLERDLHADWRLAWGEVPTGFEKVRVLVEARFEGHEAGMPPVRGNVWWDDLYMGD